MEQNECVKRQIESVCKANDKLKEEIKELKEEVVKDINGKEVNIPTEEECQNKFGVSREVWIELVKKSEFE
jgi:DNA-binding FadR family transcriptional regulator